MSSETALLVLIVSAFSLFGGVLAWATWENSRLTKQKKGEKTGR